MSLSPASLNSNELLTDFKIKSVDRKLSEPSMEEAVCVNSLQV